MGFWERLRPLNRRAWHICYECLRHNGQVAEEAIFYYAGPREPNAEGHAVARCPRCDGTNTRSFQFLKETREESALYGLERIVRTNPRGRFPSKSAPAA